MHLDSLLRRGGSGVQVIGQQHGVTNRTQHERGRLSRVEVRIRRVVVLYLFDGNIQIRDVGRPAFEFDTDSLREMDRTDQVEQM
jgi:hypothetical protein